jgi:ribosomal protection tetracycline resistance protein
VLTLNLGILAHVDAGKTSLTERLLHAVGAIDEIGSVDDGTTQTDSLDLERRRGITIRSAVVSFRVGDLTVNLIDTPGHPDFIAEVERALAVLDGAVLVVSAVEGVQPQTRVLMRALRRLRIPTLLFLNKVDRAGALPVRVLADIAERLTPAVVALGSVAAAGTRDARYTPYRDTDPAFATRLVEALADHDDELLAAYVDGATPPMRRLREQLRTQTGRALMHPVLAGSAITGAGVDALVDAIAELLPAARPDATRPLSGLVFKVERGPAGDKVAYVRLYEGALRVRDRLPMPDGSMARVTGLAVFAGGAAERRPEAVAGQIAKVWGLAGARIGDPVGRPPAVTAGRQFSPPTLETVVVPSRPGDAGALHAALTVLAEQDPLIDLRQDETRRELSVCLYGEVQKEVIGATLAEEHGIGVTFRESTTICVERPVGSGAAVEVIATPSNPFLGTVGLRLEPAAYGSGVEFRLGVELGSMPYAFIRAVEETVRETLRQGLYGWPVLDCVVTLTHSGYWARQSHAHGSFDKSMSSTAGDFRNLTPLVLMDALRRAGTAVFEPVHRFELEMPAGAVGTVLPVLTALRAVPRSAALRGSTYRMEGDVPAARVYDLQRALPGLTRGEAVVESAFDHYAAVRGPTPSRPRTDHNPLDRREYLLHVVRRV